MSVLLTMTGSEGAGTASDGGGTVMAEKVVRTRVGLHGYTPPLSPANTSEDGRLSDTISVRYTSVSRST